MNVYDIEFVLSNGLEGRAIVKDTSSNGAKQTLQLKILQEGFQMDGNDVFDVLEVEDLKTPGPTAVLIGINKYKEDI